MPNQTSRFPGGLVNETEIGPYTNHLQPKPTTYYQYFDDFLQYVATDWVVTETDAGTTEVLVAAGEGGQFAITNVSAGATDAASLQFSSDGGTTAATQFLWEATKDFVIATRFKLDVVAASLTAAVIGVAIADTTPVASLPANGIFFYKAAAAATLIASARKAGTSTSVSLGDMTADTFCEVVFAYTAVDGTWRGYFNGNFVGSFSTASVSPVVAMTPTIGLLNASAAAHVLTIDYLYCAKQR